MHTIDRKAESAALRRNIKAYKAVQAELERHHLGKHVVFHNEKLVGAFDTFHNAATEAHRRCGPDHFLIREVGAAPIQMHPMFYAGLAAGRRPAGAPDQVLTKAVVNAAGKLAVSDEDLGAILDVTEHTVEAMQDGDWALYAATQPHETIRVMATASEKAEMRKAASVAAVPLSVWLRSVGLREARRLTRG